MLGVLATQISAIHKCPTSQWKSKLRNSHIRKKALSNQKERHTDKELGKLSKAHAKTRVLSEDYAQHSTCVTLLQTEL